MVRWGVGVLCAKLLWSANNWTETVLMYLHQVLYDQTSISCTLLCVYFVWNLSYRGKMNHMQENVNFNLNKEVRRESKVYPLITRKFCWSFYLLVYMFHPCLGNTDVNLQMCLGGGGGRGGGGVGARWVVYLFNTTLGHLGMISGGGGGGRKTKTTKEVFTSNAGCYRNAVGMAKNKHNKTTADITNK